MKLKKKERMLQTLAPHQRIIIALDLQDPFVALSLAEKLAPHVGCFKYGLELITSIWPNLLTCAPNLAASRLEGYRRLWEATRGQIFWDGKFHDIPNTTGRATAQAERMEVRMLNVHASSGPKPIREASRQKGNALLLAVTVLTSISKEKCREIYGQNHKQTVHSLARTAQWAGADGIICSAEETGILRKNRRLQNMLLVTPGIRLDPSKKHDQSRVKTPYGAIMAGADYLVIGRPVTEHENPTEAAQMVAEEISQALKDRGLRYN